MTEHGKRQTEAGMVENCAKAIAEWNNNYVGEEIQWVLYVGDARAAIAAMRDPTVEMLSEGEDSQDGNRYAGASLAKAVWRNMIDAALAEPH